MARVPGRYWKQAINAGGRMHRRENLILFAMVVLLGLVPVAVLVFFWWIGFGLTFGLGAPEPTPQENAKRFFPALFEDLVLRRHRMDLVHGEVPPTFTGSSTKWFEVSVWPEDVPGIEQILGRKLRSVSAMPGTLATAPSWWHPEKLSDGQIYSRERGTNCFYVTSRSTGTIYYYDQGH